MLEQIEGIILKKIPYNDHSNIVYFYTHNYGFLPAVVKKSQRAKNNHAAFLMPMGIVYGQVLYKPNRDLQHFNYIHSEYHLFSIRENFDKLSIVQFISEFLYQTIQYPQPEKRLYLFIKEWVLKLDEQTRNQSANMHFFAMIKMLTFLGIEPEHNFSAQKPFFDIQKACFSASSLTNDQENEIISNLWALMLSANYENLYQIKISRELRTPFIQSILKYYAIHLDIDIKLSSLEVLSHVYDEIIAE